MKKPGVQSKMLEHRVSWGSILVGVKLEPALSETRGRTPFIRLNCPAGSQHNHFLPNIFPPLISRTFHGPFPLRSAMPPDPASRPELLVIQTEDLDAPAAAWLAQRCTLVHVPFSDTARLAESLPMAAGLIVRTYTKVDAQLLNRAPLLKVVARAGVGLDNIDLAQCRHRGITVVSTPDANGSAVTELLIATLLDILRPRLFLNTAIPPVQWVTLRKELTALRQLEGLTVGILGLGKVGARVARVVAAFNARAIYHDLREIPETARAGASPVSFDQLLAQSDILTIHVDGRPANRHLLAAAQFAKLKPSAIFINTSRGLVADTAALAAFLRANPAASAILDVHDPEPIAADNPLLGLPNARLTPHIGAATAQAHANMSWVVRDVWRVLNNEAPAFPA